MINIILVYVCLFCVCVCMFVFQVVVLPKDAFTTALKSPVHFLGYKINKDSNVLSCLNI